MWKATSSHTALKQRWSWQGDKVQVFVETLLSRFAQKHRITFVFNLCGEYVCEDITYVENVLAILPFIDILFGNLSEFEVFIDTIEAKLETSSSVIRNLRAMIRSEGVENLDMKIENICESPVGIRLLKD